MKYPVFSLSSLLLVGLSHDLPAAEGSKPAIGMADDKPNILFLLLDDLRWDALGFMGNPDVYKPHMDNLAGRSVFFTNAYHVSPICLPSRTSIMMGHYLGTHGSGFDRPTNYVVTEREFSGSYPVLLKKSGYYNGFIGKFGFAVSDGSEKINNFK